jgi:hypothetical protein
VLCKGFRLIFRDVQKKIACYFVGWHLLLFSHDVAEIAGITSYSFGEEGMNRHIILFKKVINVVYENYHGLL